MLPLSESLPDMGWNIYHWISVPQLHSSSSNNFFVVIVVVEIFSGLVLFCLFISLLPSGPAMYWGMLNVNDLIKILSRNKQGPQIGNIIVVEFFWQGEKETHLKPKKLWARWSGGCDVVRTDERLMNGIGESDECQRGNVLIISYVLLRFRRWKKIETNQQSRGGEKWWGNGGAKSVQ